MACDTRESGGGAQELLVERRDVGAIPALLQGPRVRPRAEKEAVKTWEACMG